ncbi:MAG: dihydroneopterin aldolase [Candidatus Lokiarchaeota archaeon]|nr:dihydroneopterin aldolase [Candidatus Lokiarchaeota archaeon]
MSNGKENTYFSSDINDRERACFEIGIKLGALYHILCGMPISSDPSIIESIENGIEASISCQPYVKSVKINIVREKIQGDKSTEFEYDEITGNVITAAVILEFNSVEITAKIEWIEELKYPLMFIEKIRNKN